MGIVRNIVERCHVSDSNRKVIRYVISRLKEQEKTFWKMGKFERRNLIQLCIEYHIENQKLYSDVVSGKINYEGAE